MKKSILFLSAAFVLLFSTIILPASAAKDNPFHPSGMHSREQIEFVKTQLRNRSDRYVKAYEQLTMKADAALQAPGHALADFAVPGYYVIPDLHRKNSLALQEDSFNAYACALAYTLGDDKKYADKAIALLNEWASVNKSYSEHDGVLVMSYSGTGLVIAAGLLADYKGWSAVDRAQFSDWVSNVYKKACDEIRIRKNNWADWGRLGSILSANYLNDAAEVAENIRLIKSDLFTKIADDGSMPEETRRGANGIWYTYFSLSPITAACWVAYQRTGENIFALEQDGRSIKKALDYLLYYNQHPGEWPWFENPNQGKPQGVFPTSGVFWPGNLLEAMGGIYNDQEYLKYVEPHRPICYGAHHYSWVFPTLMPVRLK